MVGEAKYFLKDSSLLHYGGIIIGFVCNEPKQNFTKKEKEKMQLLIFT